MSQSAENRCWYSARPIIGQSLLWSSENWWKWFRVCLCSVSVEAGYNAGACPLSYYTACKKCKAFVPQAFAAPTEQRRDGQGLWTVAASTSCFSSQDRCSLMMWLQAHRTCRAHPSQSAAQLPPPHAGPLIAEQGNGSVAMTWARGGAQKTSAMLRNARACHFLARSWGFVVRNSRRSHAFHLDALPQVVVWV